MTGKRKYTKQQQDRTQTQHLEKIKVEHVADCEDCGTPDVVNRKICHTYSNNPTKHWRSKCSCGKYYNPFTDEWQLISGTDLTREVIEHLKIAKKQAENAE